MLLFLIIFKYLGQHRVLGSDFGPSDQKSGKSQLTGNNFWYLTPSLALPYP